MPMPIPMPPPPSHPLRDTELLAQGARRRRRSSSCCCCCWGGLASAESGRADDGEATVPDEALT